MDPQPKALRPYVILTTAFVLLGAIAGYALFLQQRSTPRGEAAVVDDATLDAVVIRPMSPPASVDAATRARMAEAAKIVGSDPSGSTRRTAGETLLDLGPLEGALHPAGQPDRAILDVDADRVKGSVALPAQHGPLGVRAYLLVRPRHFGHDAQEVDDALRLLAGEPVGLPQVEVAHGDAGQADDPALDLDPDVGAPVEARLRQALLDPPLYLRVRRGEDRRREEERREPDEGRRPVPTASRPHDHPPHRTAGGTPRLPPYRLPKRGRAGTVKRSRSAKNNVNAVS